MTCERLAQAWSREKRGSPNPSLAEDVYALWESDRLEWHREDLWSVPHAVRYVSLEERIHFEE